MALCLDQHYVWCKYGIKMKIKYAQTGLCKGAVWNEFRERHQIHYQSIENSTIFNAELEPFLVQIRSRFNTHFS